MIKYDLPTEVPLIIEQVFPDSPAARAGLRRGDGILRAGGIDGLDLTAIQERILSAHEGDLWEIEIMRGGEQRTFTLTLDARPDEPRLSALDAIRAYGGVEVHPDGRRLQVTRVVPHSIAANGKIQIGDVLESVLIKKDLERRRRGDTRWRNVRTVKKLEELLQYAYSELDFFVGLRFDPKRGPKRHVFLSTILSSTNAL